MLRSADVFMIGQFLHNADVHAGINQFGNKQMASQVARALNVEFPVNRSKQAADTGAVIGLIELLARKQISLRCQSVFPFPLQILQIFAKFLLHLAVHIVGAFVFAFVFVVIQANHVFDFEVVGKNVFNLQVGKIDGAYTVQTAQKHHPDLLGVLHPADIGQNIFDFFIIHKLTISHFIFLSQPPDKILCNLTLGLKPRYRPGIASRPEDTRSRTPPACLCFCCK